MPAPSPAAPPGFYPRPLNPEPPPQQPQAQPAAPGQPVNPQPPAGTTPVAQGPPTVYGGLSLNNASLTEVIDLLARQEGDQLIIDAKLMERFRNNLYLETMISQYADNLKSLCTPIKPSRTS